MAGGIEDPQPARTLAVGALMAFYWITEAIPLAATALLPVVLFPVLGIMGGKEVAPLYFNHIILLFIGGFVVALAMERWNLHRRIAFRVILTLGSGRTLLVLGFMAATWFLSMWISNTATVMMMIPIAMALMTKLEETGTPAVRRFETALLLGIAYSSSLGGMATLIGTPPNLAFARILSITYPQAPEIPFLQWTVFALPLSALYLLGTFALLRLFYLRGRGAEVGASVLKEDYAKMGPLSYEEKIVLVSFLGLALLWMTRVGISQGGGGFPGWSALFARPGFIDDGTVAIGVALILFFLPARSAPGSIVDGEALRKLPWDVVLLFGGGFALAKGFHDTGLSELIGAKLAIIRGLPTPLMIAVVCTLVTFLTELTSNTATTQVILPVIAGLAAAVGVNPLLLMVPATISASCAFMLPVATPPNAIAFGTRRLDAMEMARSGVVLNLIGILLISLFAWTLGKAVFGSAAPPLWTQ